MSDSKFASGGTLKSWTIPSEFLEFRDCRCVINSYILRVYTCNYNFLFAENCSKVLRVIMKANDQAGTNEGKTNAG